MERRNSRSASVNSPARSSSSRSGIVSGILATRSMESEDFLNDEGTVVSDTSTLQEKPQMISGRGALISGLAVPNAESDGKIERTGATDLESGEEPPDSDFASYAPPNLFPTAKSNKRGSRARALEGSHPKFTNQMDHTEEALASDDERLAHLAASGGKRRRPTFWYALAFMSVLLIVAVVVVAVIVAGNHKEKLSAQQQKLSDVVASISDPAALSNSGSPQAKARHWLLFEDMLWANEANAVTREMATQRYVLAVFYFATSGASWIRNNWLQGHECGDIWNGLACNSNDQVRELTMGKCGGRLA